MFTRPSHQHILAGVLLALSLWFLPAHADLAQDMMDAASFSLSQGNVAKAREQLNRGLQADKTNAQIVSTLIQLEVMQNRMAQAQQVMAAYEKALAGKPLPANLLGFKADLLNRAGKTKEAYEVYEKILAKDPKNLDVLLRTVSYLVSTGKNQQAFDRLQGALKTNPNNPQLHYNLGVLLYTAGRPDDGVTSLKTALQLNPKMAEAHSALAQIYAALSQVYQNNAKQLQGGQGQ